MPELPEVETIVRKLQNVLPGKEISQVQILHAKSWHGESALILNQPIQAVTRRAKIIRVHFPLGKNVIIHLKMTGQIIYTDGQVRLGGGHPTADWVNELPSSHTRVVVTFADKSKLFFNDQRLFGWLKVVDDAQVDEYFSALGPEILSPDLTAEYLYKICQRRSIAIKSILMDSHIVSGIGNIYACDALNLAAISPFRPAQSLSLVEVETLLKSCQEVVARGVELGGTTFDGKYVDTEGMAGQYQTVVRVYGREGKPCPRCQTIIEKTKLAGRGTYFCPNCQV
jgi:formamidopyrimidine-DNA glycosylase